MVSYARLRDGGHDLHVVSGSQSPDPKNLVTSAMAGFHRMCPSCAQTLYNEEVADGFGSGAEEGYARAPNLAYQAAAPAPSYGGGFPAQSYAAMQPQGLQGLQGYRMQPQQVGSPLTKTCPALLTRQRPASMSQGGATCAGCGAGPRASGLSGRTDVGCAVGIALLQATHHGDSRSAT